MQGFFISHKNTALLWGTVFLCGSLFCSKSNRCWFSLTSEPYFDIFSHVAIFAHSSVLAIEEKTKRADRAFSLEKRRKASFRVLRKESVVIDSQ